VWPAVVWPAVVLPAVVWPAAVLPAAVWPAAVLPAAVLPAAVRHGHLPASCRYLLIGARMRPITQRKESPNGSSHRQLQRLGRPGDDRPD